MTFSINKLLNSLAALLKEAYPDYPVYSSPNQQGSAFPCFFLFLMPSTIESQMDERFYRDLGIDIIFVQQRNVINGNVEIQEIWEYLDERLELFRYEDGSGKTALVRTYERKASVEDQELHYQFHVKQRVSVPNNDPGMEEFESETGGIK